MFHHCLHHALVLGSQKMLICWDFPGKPPLGFTENGPRKRPTLPIRSLKGKYFVNARCQRRMAKKLQTDRKETVTVSTLYSQGNSENLEQCREAREKWKNIACFDEPWLMLQHLDGKINIWSEKKWRHGSILHSCCFQVWVKIVQTVQPCPVIALIIFSYICICLSRRKWDHTKIN